MVVGAYQTKPGRMLRLLVVSHESYSNLVRFQLYHNFVVQASDLTALPPQEIYFKGHGV